MKIPFAFDTSPKSKVVESSQLSFYNLIIKGKTLGFLKLFSNHLTSKRNITLMRLLISTIFTLFFYSSFSQQIEKVSVDFKTKTISEPDLKKLRKADYVQIMITGIPMNKYLVSIGKRDSIITLGTPPALFSALSFGDGYTKLLANLTDFSVGTVTVIKDNPTNIDKALMDAVNWDKLSSLSEKSNDFAGFDKNSNKLKIPSLMDTMKKMRLEIFNSHYKFKKDVIDEADNLILDYTIKRIDSCKTFEIKFKGILDKRNQLSQALDKSYLLYYDEILPKYDVITQHVPLLKADSMIEHYRKDFFSFLGKFDSAFNKSLISKICVQLNAPKPDTQFISLPYPIRGADINTLLVKIDPLDTSKDKQGYATENSIT